MQSNNQQSTGCFSSSIIAIIIWLLLIAMATSSCSQRQYTGLLPEGKVIQQDGDRLLILFHATDNPDIRAIEWFHFPGIGPVEFWDMDATIQLRRRNYAKD